LNIILCSLLFLIQQADLSFWIKTTLHFYAPPVDGSPPEFRVTHESGSGTKNYGHNPVQVTIRDMRQRQSEFSLERNSFQAVPFPTHTFIDFDDPAEIDRFYYPEVMDLIMNHINDAKYVFIFDHCARKVTPDKSKQRPVRKVHIDQTPSAALARYRLHAPEVVKEMYEESGYASSTFGDQSRDQSVIIILQLRTLRHWRGMTWWRLLTSIRIEWGRLMELGIIRSRNSGI
jgi:hypothetical protein